MFLVRSLLYLRQAYTQRWIEINRILHVIESGVKPWGFTGSMQYQWNIIPTNHHSLIYFINRCFHTNRFYHQFQTVFQQFYVQILSVQYQTVIQSFLLSRTIPVQQVIHVSCESLLRSRRSFTQGIRIWIIVTEFNQCIVQ